VIARKFCVLALGILVIGYSSSVTAEVPEIGQKAPEFRLSPSAGHALKLSEFTAKGTLALVADLRETTRLTRLFNLADTVTNSAVAILSMRRSHRLLAESASVRGLRKASIDCATPQDWSEKDS
jgi:hypothetical protein